MFKSATAIFLLFLSLLTASTAFSEEPALTRTISLTGHGEVRAAPDIATLTLGVFTNAETANAALDANSAAMSKLFDALKQAGIADKDMQTSSLMVSPHYSDRSSSSGQPETAGFDVSNNVSVTIRDLKSLGKILDQAVSSGANQINGLSFGIENEGPVQDEARKRAVTEAKRKAELYAATAEISLGRIVLLNEGGFYQPQPQMFQAARMKEAAAPVPIAQGEQTVAIDVTMTWEIK